MTLKWLIIVCVVKQTVNDYPPICFYKELLVPLSILEAAENPYGEDDSKSPFPVQPSVKRSYALNATVWIKASGLQVWKCLCMHAPLIVKRNVKSKA